MTIEERFIIDTLGEYGLQVIDVHMGIEDRADPMIQVGRESYPGVEPHLVTIADIAGWIPNIARENDVILTLPLSAIFVEESISLGVYRNSWDRLLSTTRRVMEFLEGYREQVSGSYAPSVLWVHHFMDWRHRTWSSRRLEPKPVDQWIEYVDRSIRTHIKELNEFGLVTRESCSGHPEDHQFRDAFWPYVMFEERAYPGISAHLFTLADIASWIPVLGRHGFDVSLEVPHNMELTAENIESAWNNLISSTRQLMPLLDDYISRSQLDSQTSIFNPSLFRMHMSSDPKGYSDGDIMDFHTDSSSPSQTKSD